MAINDDEADELLQTPKEDVHFLKDKVSNQSSQLVEKDSSSSAYKERVVVLEKALANASAAVMRLTRQCTADNNSLYVVRTALALHKKASK